MKFLSGVILNISTITGPSKGFVFYICTLPRLLMVSFMSALWLMSLFHPEIVAKGSLLVFMVWDLGGILQERNPEPSRFPDLYFNHVFAQISLTVHHQGKLVVRCRFGRVCQFSQLWKWRLEVSQGGDFSHSHLCLSFIAGCFQKHSRDGRAGASLYL